MRLRQKEGEAPKWREYLPVFVQVQVKFRPRRRPDGPVTLAPGATVADLVRAVGDSVDTVLVVRGDTPLSEGQPLRDGEELLVLSAFSGG